MTVSSYLSRYGNQATTLATPPRRYLYAMVIPIYDESPDCLDKVLSHHQKTDVLTIAVVNAPDDAPLDALGRTQHLTSTLDGRPATMVLDHCTQAQLPRRQGVGLARKIGTDTALALHQDGWIKSPWLFQTDADVLLPREYFHTPPGTGAVVFKHQHVAPKTGPNAQAIKKAAELYDAHMSYYIAGLAWAGSTYAFPTLGSTIAVHAESYARVRGYPKRNAAEDFYLLNKIAKVDEVRFEPTVELIIQARDSARVPFGTGPALRKIVQLLELDPSGATYLSYHPNSFVLLRDTLRELASLAQSTEPFALSEKASQLLHDLGFDKLHNTLHAKYRSQSQRAHVLREWFDGFRTLRFIHEARRFNPDQPLLQTLERLPWNA
ncbi:MAG: hypothetical protein AAF541_20805 [Pseudomonadota bacterium]